MTCDHYQQLASAFIDDELEEGKTRTLFEHLSTCDTCWRYYRRIERLHSLLAEEHAFARARMQEGRSETTRPGRKKLPGRRSPQPEWLTQEVSLRSASVLLGIFMAFLLGVLVTLFVVSFDDGAREGVWAVGNSTPSSSVSLQHAGNHVPLSVSPR